MSNEQNLPKNLKISLTELTHEDAQEVARIIGTSYGPNPEDEATFDAYGLGYYLLTFFDKGGDRFEPFVAVRLLNWLIQSNYQIPASIPRIALSAKPEVDGDLVERMEYAIAASVPGWDGDFKIINRAAEACAALCTPQQGVSKYQLYEAVPVGDALPEVPGIYPAFYKEGGALNSGVYYLPGTDNNVLVDSEFYSHWLRPLTSLPAAHAVPDSGERAVMQRMAERLFDEIGDWSRKAFPDCTEHHHLLKLKIEAQEAIDNPSDLTEYADCTIALFAAAHKAGFSIADLLDSAGEKLRKVKSMDWHKNPDGTYQSIKPSTLSPSTNANDGK